MGPARCTPVALGFNGSERRSILGSVANNGENIGRWRQSLGMRRRSSTLREARAVSACIPWRPVWGLLCVPRFFE